MQTDKNIDYEGSNMKRNTLNKKFGNSTFYKTYSIKL